MNLILVDREAKPAELKRLIKECEQAKAQNKILIIYPEGTRSQSGQLHPFKSGTVYLAYKLNLPIIPAAIIGSGKALPRNRWFVRPTPIHIRFDEAILLERIEGLSQKKTLQALTEKLEESIKELLNKK